MSYGEYRIGTPGLSGMVRTLLFITCGVYVLQILPGIGNVVFSSFAASPVLILKGQFWRLLSYGFLHSRSDIFHIVFNMFGLWMFGTAIEARLGRSRFLAFYLMAIIFAGISTLFYLVQGISPLVVGASGAIYAIITLYAVYYPNDQIYIWGVLPLKARTFAVLFAVISFVGTVRGAGGIAHVAHLAGILFGFLYIKFEKPVSLWYKSLLKAKHTSSKKTTIHYYEPRKSRKEINDEKAEIDRVLKKISTDGMDSLTESEYRILEKVSGKPVERK